MVQISLETPETGNPPREGGHAAYILTLDEGLLHKICSVLSVNDLLSAQCTCRQLKDFISQDKTLWKSLVIPHRAARRLTDARLVLLISRAEGSLEALELWGGTEVTGSFLLSDGMKASTQLEKLWLLECPNLSSASVVNLVGHIVQTCSHEGLAPRLSSIRLGGSLNVYGKHVRMLDRLLTPTLRLDSLNLDVTCCPSCPKAGRVKVCRMVSLLEQLASRNGEGGPEGGGSTALVRGGEIGCESCLIACILCQEHYCSAHLFSLPCGLSGVCCMCCGTHECSVCDER